ncbi:MAG TPA: NADPH:quinone oxidoreductase family protein [Symbiobacteriaceae bacterium]|nr:NADPH:quinone oxidoreductase family protein [Symbiobacteriaceae bacterium]
MKAVVLRRPGAPEELALTEMQPPSAGPGRVLIRVRAAGVGFADLLVRQGRYPGSYPLPAVPGTEVAGVVEAVGQGVVHVAPGDRVMAMLPPGGGYAEQCAAEGAHVFPLPEGMGFADGAAFLVAFLSAFIPLHYQAQVAPGSVVMVHAAAGGVGSAAVQLARQMGARVAATAGSEEKVAVARSLGAEVAVNYRTPDFIERLREATGGVDTVLDTVGGMVFEPSLKLLKPLGRLVIIGFAGGAQPPVDTAMLVGRNIGVEGFYLGRLIARTPDLVKQAAEAVISLWRAGEVRPLVGVRFPLGEAAAAHRLIEERRSIGKVVLEP